MHRILFTIVVVAAMLLDVSSAYSQAASAASAAASSSAPSPSVVPTSSAQQLANAPVLVSSSARQAATPSASTLEPKDYALAAGVAVTFLLGIWNAVANHRFNRRTTFVNTVTSQRIKWIEQLRQDIGAYCGITYHWSHSDVHGKPGEDDMLKEVDRLRHVIRLRLNPLGEHDKIIEALIEEIPKYTDPSRQSELVDALERLTKATQALLKEEWDKVKRESEYGPLSERA